MFKEDFNSPAKVAPALDEAGQALMKAVQIIRERGWCQGRFQNDAGQVCAIGALLAATRTNTVTGVWPSALDKAYDALSNEVKASVPDWNDFPGRTKDEVISVLEIAARALREQHP